MLALSWAKLLESEVLQRLATDACTIAPEFVGCLTRLAVHDAFHAWRMIMQCPFPTMHIHIQTGLAAPQEWK